MLGRYAIQLLSLVRFAATAAFAYLAYDNFKSQEDGKGFLFAALAVLFPPFFNIALGRTLWNAVDVIVAIALFYFLISEFNGITDNLLFKRIQHFSVCLIYQRVVPLYIDICHTAVRMPQRFTYHIHRYLTFGCQSSPSVTCPVTT